MLEACFPLIYHLKLDMASVEAMSPREQQWWITRLNKQYKHEEKYYKQQAKKKQGASKLLMD